MTAADILAELKTMGVKNIQRIFEQHGVKEPTYGVKIGDLKTIQKKIEKNHELSLELYETGVSDARYLAGLIADEKRISKKELEHWLSATESSIHIEYTVPWVASESAHGWELGLKWIDAKDEKTQTAGWATLSNVAALKADTDLDKDKLKALLKKVEKDIAKAGNRVRYVMNGFVISVGCYVSAFTTEAQELGKRLGKITVDMNGTACKVPYSPDYIQKVIDRGTVGKKKKMARC
ncbi:MAG: alkylation repair protein [Flaviaesturariibacter sp.]|nr:alkylation repair protein [Flaviaesturariibacter sp.]